MEKNYRDTNTRLGDISYQLSEIAKYLKILIGSDLTIDPDYFNAKMKEKHGKKE